eukprot:scaffold101321_cov40-Prasinocladus_malaysianus.AAC.1
MIRQLRLPLLVMPMVLICYTNRIALLTIMWRDDQDDLLWFRAAVIFLTIFAIIYGFGLLIWSRLLHDTYDVLCHAWRHSALPAGMTAWGQSSSRSINLSKRASGTRNVAAAGNGRASNHANNSNMESMVHEHDRSAVHQKKLVALFCSMYLLGIAGGADEISYAVTTLGRLISLLTLLFIREKPCTMADITMDDAALGLVIDAPQFARAVRARLQGKAPVEEILTFKATALRMSRTMAVSYRWQNRETPINSQLALN